MILLFLGSWRSTLIVCISIPLSILTSLCILSLLGETINVMTLGGLALAVGILVDDATVEIENTHRNIAMRKPLVRAVLDGASQIAVPTFVSTLSICIVFVPVLLLTGTARYLFTPLAMAVVFAMLASYLLSRTLVPTMVALSARVRKRTCIRRARTARPPADAGIFWRVHYMFNAVFEKPALPLHGTAGLVAAASRARAGRLYGAFRRLDRPGLAGRRGFLPQRGFRPNAAARARARGHAHRRDRSAIRRDRARNPRTSSPRARWTTLIDNIGLVEQLGLPRSGRNPDHLQRRWRDPDFSEEGP